ncbi:uncharacterized protein BDV17DRAFT_56245 [Aspergillus undulatus]|uniref:uncharacterized protein n=1 Tax=Aspergillus undulatus TaxID=1810928 RepID=UPI003CCCAA53
MNSLSSRLPARLSVWAVVCGFRWIDIGISCSRMTWTLYYCTAAAVVVKYSGLENGIGQLLVCVKETRGLSLSRAKNEIIGMQRTDGRELHNIRSEGPRGPEVYIYFGRLGYFWHERLWVSIFCLEHPHPLAPYSISTWYWYFWSPATEMTSPGGHPPRTLRSVMLIVVHSLAMLLLFTILSRLNFLV